MSNHSSPNGISYFTEQKLIVCLCKGQLHPNTVVDFVAPEIHIIDAEADSSLGLCIESQPLQLLLVNIWHSPDYNRLKIYITSVSSKDNYIGKAYQQVLSSISALDGSWYVYGNGDYAFQHNDYQHFPDVINGYLRWFV